MIILKAGTKAATKAEAAGIVYRMAEGQQPTENEITALLKFFHPSASPKKDGFAWVASFCSKGKKEYREGMKYVYSDGSRIMATNGHALAWRADNRQEGYYCPKTGNPVSGVDYKFPDIDRVIPFIGEGERITLEKTEIEVREKGLKVRRVGSAVFLEDYINLALTGGNAIGYLVSNDKAMRGSSDMGEFVIMPRRD